MTGELTPETQQPYGIPEGAKLVAAAGEPCAESLADEYRPSSERRATLAEDMERIRDAERRAWAESHHIRLYGVGVEL